MMNAYAKKIPVLRSRRRVKQTSEVHKLNSLTNNGLNLFSVSLVESFDMANKTLDNVGQFSDF